MIEFRNVTKVYRPGGIPKVILNGVSGILDSKKSYGLLGQNGAGKSTMIRLLGGTELPTRGRIIRTGTCSWPLGLGGMFHGSMTMRENAIFVARAYGQDVVRVLEFTADFSQIGRQHFNALPNALSSGQMARFAFGLSMAIQFDFYLLDEITAVGDEKFQARCRNAFAERRSQSGLILASHHAGTIIDYCQHGLVLHNGDLVYFEAVEEAIEYHRSTHL